MAVCINLLFISSDDTKQLELTVRHMETKFQCYYIHDQSTLTTAWNDSYEMEFTSEDIFPETEMKRFTDRITDAKLQIIAISYEVTTEYLGYHIYKHQKWNKMYEHRNKILSL